MLLRTVALIAILASFARAEDEPFVRIPFRLDWLRGTFTPPFDAGLRLALDACQPLDDHHQETGDTPAQAVRLQTFSERTDTLPVPETGMRSSDRPT
jgi:hypothetical protein